MREREEKGGRRVKREVGIGGDRREREEGIRYGVREIVHSTLLTNNLPGRFFPPFFFKTQLLSRE